MFMCVVLFFKQKTAYEMRISDWSSDVCSSDLLAGKPFIGPAGQIFDRALGEAGIDRAKVYVTNAVKHFKFEQRGKRRLHSKPDAGEIEACRWWLDKERAIIRPTLTIALGAKAGRAILGHPVIGRASGRERGCQ